MAKRFTDTDKWVDDWYLSLDNDCRIVWQWLLDNCNHAGICKPNIFALNMMCKTNFTEEWLIEKMAGRVIKVDKIWFIPKFLKFQYKTLKSLKPVIQSVVKLLFEYNCVGMIPESFGNDYVIVEQSFNNYYITVKEQLSNHYIMIKDKDKDKDMDKDIDKDKEIIIKETREEKNSLPGPYLDTFLKIFYEENPEYPKDRDKDLRPAREIYDFLKNKGMSGDELFDYWRHLAKRRALNSFYGKLPLKTISSQIQGLIELKDEQSKIDKFKKWNLG